MSIVKNRNKYLMYDDEEPPLKKVISDGDLLIKKLIEKQQNTKVNLKEQLQNPKVFEKSTDFVPITKNLRGKCALSEFEDAAMRLEERTLFKSAGLSEEDIQLVLDFRDGTLYDKHRNFEQSLLKDRMDKLVATIEDFHKKNQSCNSFSVKNIQDRHKTEFGLSIKPESTQTKLLKFALQNEQTKRTNFPHPMDNIKEVEWNLFNSSIEEFKSPIKIQKKLRKLAQKVNNMDGNLTAISKKEQDLKHNNNNVCVSYVKESKWDKRDVTTINTEEVKQQRIFTCKPQNYYTIKNGAIVKLSENEMKSKNLEVSDQLSIEEIKKLPKFTNYEVGVPSTILYAKNLPRNIKEPDLKRLFSKYNKDERLQFKVMSGRMKGQAFITFPEVNLAAFALENVNGMVMGDRPIVLEFGRQST